MSKVVVERIRGGINPLKGRGEVDGGALSAASKAALDERFATSERALPKGNEPVYRITRQTSKGHESVDVPEHMMPPGLVGSVKDELP